MAAVVGNHTINIESDIDSLDIDVARLARIELNSSASKGSRFSHSLGATEMVSFQRETETASIQESTALASAAEGAEGIRRFVRSLLSFIRSPLHSSRQWSEGKDSSNSNQARTYGLLARTRRSSRPTCTFT